MYFAIDNIPFFVSETVFFFCRLILHGSDAQWLYTLVQRGSPNTAQCDWRENVFNSAWSDLPEYWGQDHRKLSHFNVKFYQFRVPTRTGKSGKMGRHFPAREKSWNFEQIGKVREITQNTGKLRKFQTNVICYFLVIAKWICVLFATFDQVSSSKNKTLKKYWENGKKYWENQRKS